MANKIIVSNNHIIIEIPEGRYLLDVGSINSISFNNEYITLGNNKYRVYKHIPNVPKEEFLDEPGYFELRNDLPKLCEELTGLKADGIIGNDRLLSTGITIDPINLEVEFKTYRSENYINTNLYYYEEGQALITTDDLVINDIEIKHVLLDSSGVCNYVGKKVLKDCEKIGLVKDTNFNFKNHKNVAYKSTIKYNNEVIETSFCGISGAELSGKLRYHKFNGIVLFHELFNGKKISIDYIDEKIYIF